MKKNVYAFLIKVTFIYWTRLKTSKLLATAQQLIRKNSLFAVWKIRQFFFTEQTYRYAWPIPPTAHFCLLFKEPSPPSTLNALGEWSKSGNRGKYMLFTFCTFIEIYGYFKFRDQLFNCRDNSKMEEVWYCCFMQNSCVLKCLPDV